MLAGFTIEQVRAFYAKNFGAKRAHLYVVGVFDAAPVEQAVRAAFGDWAAGPAPATDLPAMHKTRSLALIDRPGAVQSTILMGLPVADPTSKDFTALEVTDALLGGTFGSRITTNIREQKGYTYSPFSQISTRYHTAYWAEEADVTTNVTGASLKEIFGEIDRLRKEAPPPIELAGVKNNMVGLFTLRNGSREGIIGQLDFVNRQGLPESYLTEYVKRVMAVSPDEVRKSAQTYLAPERMTIVVVGDRKTVEEQVAPYAAATP
jgi:predicted Zn-dependent peptidase